MAKSKVAKKSVDRRAELIAEGKTEAEITETLIAEGYITNETN